MSAPLTPERLARIKRRYANARRALSFDAVAIIDSLLDYISDQEAKATQEWVRAEDAEAEVDRLRAQVIAAHRPTDPTHGRGGKTICACGELSWPCPALASGDEVQP